MEKLILLLDEIEREIDSGLERYLSEGEMGRLEAQRPVVTESIDHITSVEAAEFTLSAKSVLAKLKKLNS